MMPAPGFANDPNFLASLAQWNAAQQAAPQQQATPSITLSDPRKQWGYDDNVSGWLDVGGQLYDSSVFNKGASMLGSDGRMFSKWDGPQGQYATPELSQQAIQHTDGNWYLPEGAMQQYRDILKPMQDQDFFGKMGAGILGLPVAGFAGAGGFAAMGAGAGAAGAEGAAMGTGGGMGGAAGATSYPFAGSGAYTVAPLFENGATGAAWGAGEGTLGATMGGSGLASAAGSGLGGIADNFIVDPVDAGGDTMLNPFGGGAGGSLGAHSGPGFWENLFGSAFSGAGKGLGGVLGGLLPSLIGAGGNLYALDQFKDLINKAQEQADPFASQRPQYQQMLSQMTTDPNFVKNSPVFQNIMNPAIKETQAAMSARGYNNSGNMLEEINKRGVEEASKFYLPMMNQIGGFAGAGFGPGQSGTIGAQGAFGQTNQLKDIFGDLGLGAYNLMTGSNNTKQAPNIINGGSGGGPNLMSLFS